MNCSAGVRPWPPYSFGQPTPSHPPPPLWRTTSREAAPPASGPGSAARRSGVIKRSKYARSSRCSSRCSGVRSMRRDLDATVGSQQTATSSSFREGRTPMAEPVIIEAAINGVTSKEQNPHTPREPGEIADDALRCFAAGAAIVHNHVDVFAVHGDVAGERYLEGWRPVLAERPDALLYPTVNAGPDVQTSYAHLAYLADACGMRIGLSDPGSVNLGGFGDDGLPAGGVVYANSFDDIRYQL